MELYSAVKVISTGRTGTIVDFDEEHDEPIHLVEYTDTDDNDRIDWVDASDLVEIEPRYFPPIEYDGPTEPVKRLGDMGPDDFRRFLVYLVEGLMNAKALAKNKEAVREIELMIEDIAYSLGG